MDTDAPLLPTQRPLTLEELSRLLEPLGTVEDEWLMPGGSFCAVQGVALDTGATVVVKASVPEAADASGRSRLLTYEHRMLAAEREMLALAAQLPGVPAPDVLLADFSREHLDVDALVMTMVPGMNLTDAESVMTRSTTMRAHENVGRVLAALERGRGPRFGFPAADFRLGADDWPTFVRALVDATVNDAQVWGVDIAGARLQDAVEAAEQALAEVTVPALVHADVWAGNVLVDPQTGMVTGVVDFERSLFGDPLWALVGGETHSSGPFDPSKVRGYLEAGGTLPLDDGTTTGLMRSAEMRVCVYRLWSMAVQLIEIEPRGFAGDWLDSHRASIVANRDRLFSILER